MAIILSFLTINLCYGQNNAKQIWAKGVEYAAQGKFKEAKGEFEKALKVDPLYGSAKRALKVIEDVVDQKIKSKTALHLFKGISYSNKEQWDAAVAEVNKALEINPRYAYAYNIRGLAYNRNGQHDKAIADFTKAIEINPSNALPYGFRGASYAGKGQHERAIADYTKFIEIDPIDALAYYNRGISYNAKGNMKKACSDWKKACELGYCKSWGMLNKIRCLFK